MKKEKYVDSFLLIFHCLVFGLAKARAADGQERAYRIHRFVGANGLGGEQHLGHNIKGVG